jgi:CheY-like chemotaxis protein
MQVFISSVITGYEDFRDAVAAAVRSLGHEVIQAENLGSLQDTPQQACLGGVRQADVAILLMGARYGAIQPSGFSATEEEYREARESKPVLVFVEQAVDRETRQQAFLAEVQGWAGGQMTESFTDPESLRQAVTRQLHRLELSQQVGTADPDEMQARAMSLVPESNRNSYKDSLILAVAGGPRQSILRPAVIESNELYEALLREAQFGRHRVLDTRHGTQHGVREDALTLAQPDGSVYLNEEGSVRVMMPARDSKGDGIASLPVIIHEDIEERLARAIGYVGWLLAHVDPTNRLTRVAIVAAVQGGGHVGWRTRAEHARSPNTLQMDPWATGGAVGLSPPDRARGALRTNRCEIAEDLAIRLRRKQQG